MPTPNSPIVAKATRASASDLAELIPDNPDDNLRRTVIHAEHLSAEHRHAIQALLCDNMYSLYAQSSLGWKPIEKEKELFNPHSRFVLLQDEQNRLVAFAMFRFEYEEKERLLYCYEIQVASSSRGKGLGTRLMQDLLMIGARQRMHKIMLTVLKKNSSARVFYHKLAFQVDPSSPDGDDGDVDYEILSQYLSN